MKESSAAASDTTERSAMDDNTIIELLLQRAEAALSEISCKYARLYRQTIREILGDECDVDECANDVLLAVWNSIPPNRPDSLPAYLRTLARRIGIDRLRYNTRQKRNAGYLVMLSELEECLPAEKPTEPHHDERSERIRLILSDFVRSLNPETQVLFVRRYVYLESVASLAERFGLSENHVSVRLYRARKALRKTLEQEDIRL